jgi:hypothetical protein
MRKRRSAPSRIFSTKSFRRNSAAVIAIGFFVLLASACSPVSAPTGTLSAAILEEKTGLVLTAAYRLVDNSDILDAVERGLKSRVVFTVQVVERRPPAFLFPAEAQVAEKIIETVGYKDFYENVYILEDAVGRKTAFERVDEFLSALTSLRGLPLGELLPGRKKSPLFVRLQVKVYPVKLVAPLTLAYLLSSSGVIESGWTLVALP